jgi:anion-transporting  ArsA/GET3 family ATPase
MQGSEKNIAFVTGKGGAGKSVFAASLAIRAAKEGRKVLLAEIGDRSFYEGFFGIEKVSYRPTPAAKNLSVALWDGEGCLREYVLHFLKIESIMKIFFKNRVVKAFFDIAPGLRELGILGKVTSGIRNVGPPMDFDLLVVDSHASGHFQSLMKAPEAVGNILAKGPVGEQSREIARIVRNPRQTRIYIVAFPEELPVKEAKELYSSLKENLGLKPWLVYNRILKPPFDPNSESLSEAQKKRWEDFLNYLRTILKRQSELEEEIKELGANYVRVPLIFSHKGAELAEAMAKEFEWINC